MSEFNYCLLITACIAPNVSNNNFVLKQSDVLSRLNEYEKQIERWLLLSNDIFDKVILVENSGYNLSSIQNIFENKNPHNKKFEILQYTENSNIKNVHYGYYEFLMLDFAMSNSKLIYSNDFIIKTTGRLYFPKISKLISYHKAHNVDFLSDSRDYRLFGSEQKYILSTLFVFSKAFYDSNILGHGEIMKKQKYYYIEHAYWELVGKQKNNVNLRFPFNVDPVGLSGSSGKDYRSVNNVVKNLLRAIVRKVIPKFKI